MDKNSVRKPWVAAVLSFFAFPAGQLYAGAMRTAVVASFVWVLILSSPVLAIRYLPYGKAVVLFFFAAILCLPFWASINAWRLAARNNETRRKRFQHWWVYLLAPLLFAATLESVRQTTKRLWIENFVITSRAMSPLVCEGDRILVERLWSAKTAERNDLVVYQVPDRPGVATISRIVGLGGDRLSIKNETLHVNGIPQAEPFAFLDPDTPLNPENSQKEETTVPEGHVFLLSDNRRISLDSRHFGPLPISSIVGQPFTIYWSYSSDREITRHAADPIPGRKDFLKPGINWNRVGMRLD